MPGRRADADDVRGARERRLGHSHRRVCWPRTRPIACRLWMRPRGVRPPASAEAGEYTPSAGCADSAGRAVGPPTRVKPRRGPTAGWSPCRPRSCGPTIARFQPVRTSDVPGYQPDERDRGCDVPPALRDHRPDAADREPPPCSADPCHAEEVARWLPTSVVIAAADMGFAVWAQQRFGTVPVFGCTRTPTESGWSWPGR